jgi:hypothetical protein
MKRILFVFILVQLAIMGFAQIEKGRLTIEPHIGMTVANLVGSSSMGSTGQIGLMGGFEFQYGISERFSFSVGANYAQYGARDHGEHGLAAHVTAIPVGTPPIGGNYTIVISEKNSLNYHVDYLTFPLTIAFHPYQGLFFRTGVQLGVKTKAKVKGETTVLGHLSPTDITTTDLMIGTGVSSGEFDMDMGDDVRPIDIGIPVGIGYEYKKVTLDARYLFGLLNVSKEDGEHLRNSAFMFTLGYKIPFPKR